MHANLLTHTNDNGHFLHHTCHTNLSSPLLGECDRQRIFWQVLFKCCERERETNENFDLLIFPCFRFKFLFAQHENSCHTKLSEAVKKNLPSHGGTTPYTDEMESRRFAKSCVASGNFETLSNAQYEPSPGFWIFWKRVDNTQYILTSNNHIISFTFVHIQGRTKWP